MKKFDMVLKVVNYIEANKAAKVDEISEQTGVPRDMVVQIVARLVAVEYMPAEPVKWYKDPDLWLRVAVVFTIGTAFVYCAMVMNAIF